MEKMLTGRNTVLLIGCLALWRLYLSATLQLHPDEAYYWLWSLHPDFSYFDHPPLVAWFIGLTTWGSQSELWLRLSGTLVSLASSALAWLLAMQLSRNKTVAAGSVLLLNAFPITLLGLIVITPDVPLFLFWSLSVYLFWQIMHSGRTWLWYGLGLSFGLALLAKYTAILLAPGLLLYLLLSQDRRWLRTVHPYLALLLGLLCFLPVLYWNSRHDWVSFAFQLRNGLDKQGYAGSQVGDYLAGQALVVGPLAWLVGLYAGGRGLLRRSRPALLLACSALPVIAFFALTSLKKTAGPNWPMMACFSLSLLASQYTLGSSSRIRRALWGVAFVSSLAWSVTVTLHARFNLLPLARISPNLAAADATNWFHGWRELGTELRQQPGLKLVLTPSHQLSAEVIYYTQSAVQAQTDRSARPSEFNLWRWPPDLDDRSVLYLWTDQDQAGPYRDYLAAPTAATSFQVRRNGAVLRTYHMVAGQSRQGAPNGSAPARP